MFVSTVEICYRCSKSLNEGVESAHHEEMMTKIWCEEAYTRYNHLDEECTPVLNSRLTI